MKKFIFLIPVLFILASTALALDQININFTQPPNTPYFIGNPEINIDAEEFTTVVIKIKADKSGAARLFFASSYDPQMNEPKSLWFFLNKGTKEYVFNLKSQNPNWIGFIGQFLIYPEAEIQIASATAIPGNFFSNVKSGWQEFWGPRGRLIEGSTVNNMRALTLFGKPFNFYIYSLVVMLAFLSFVYYYWKTKDLSLSWQNCGRITILASLAFWALLEVSNTFSQYKQFTLDFKRYAFKSLEEKHRLAADELGKGFYAFLLFCQKEIPQKSTIQCLNDDYRKGRAAYFLYPMDSFSTREPDYLIAHNYPKDLRTTLKEHPGFRLLKKMDERSFILWKQ